MKAFVWTFVSSSIFYIVLVEEGRDGDGENVRWSECNQAWCPQWEIITAEMFTTGLKRSTDPGPGTGEQRWPSLAPACDGGLGTPSAEEGSSILTSILCTTFLRSRILKEGHTALAASYNSFHNLCI